MRSVVTIALQADDGAEKEHGVARSLRKAALIRGTVMQLSSGARRKRPHGNQRPVTPGTMSNAAHIVQFFRSDDEYVRAAGYFLREGLQAGRDLRGSRNGRAPSAARTISARCRPGAADRSPAEYRYVPLQAEQMLPAFFDARDGIDQERFHRQIQSADQSGRLARATGANFRRNGVATGGARPARRGHRARRAMERAEPAAPLHFVLFLQSVAVHREPAISQAPASACTITWCAKAPEAAGSINSITRLSAPRFAATIALAFAPISARACGLA